jgi:hypothetical protein
MKYVLASAAVLAMAVPALADEYYVVRESGSGDCRVVSERPVEKTWVQVGDVTFATREEADERLKVICRDDHDSVDGADAEVHIGK